LDSPPCGRVPSFKIPNLSFVLVIEYWNLRFVCNLVLGVWDFIDSATPLLPQSPARRKDRKSPLWRQLEARSFGHDSSWNLKMKLPGVPLCERKGECACWFSSSLVNLEFFAQLFLYRLWYQAGHTTPRLNYLLDYSG